MRYLVPVPLQYVDETGVPYSGGTVSVYRAGTPELANIYQNSSSDELKVNPVHLDSIGMWQAFVDAGVPLDYIVKDQYGNVIAPFTGISVNAGSGSGSGDVTKAYVDANDDEIRESVSGVGSSLNEERVRAEAAEKAAKSVVEPGVGISVEERVGDDGNSIYTVNSDGVSDVEISSPNDTISVSRTKNASTGVEHFNIDVKNATGDYINIASSIAEQGQATRTIDASERRYVPLADSELSGLVGRTGITLEDSEDDVTNAMAVLERQKKYLCAAQLQVYLDGTASGLIDVNVFAKVGNQEWLAGTFSVDAGSEHATSKTLTWMVENSEYTCLQAVLADEESEYEIVVEVKQIFIAEFSALLGNGGGGNVYLPGDAISIVDNAISVKYGNTLEVNTTTGKLEVSESVLDTISDLQDQIDAVDAKGLMVVNGQLRFG